ncbi:MAG: GNAT family N-acetyltransferase [Steroidobacteraceae bacterium]
MTIEALSAKPSEAQLVLDVISSAFSADPTWSWAFPDLAARRRFMNLFIHGALRFPCVFRTAGFESVAVWIPPGESEFSKEQEAGIPALLAELVGSRAADVAELLSRFGEAHPHTEPHYYLSLLGVHSEHRGRGLGMALLKENLTRVDAQRMPAYLESTNPANNQRYQSLGFKPASSFRAPRNGPTVTGMWRDRR